MEKKPKRGLVLEGGGIRSAYLAGVMLALRDRGVNHFDVVAGTSAGACCAANFVSGEPEKNKIILEDYLAGKRFVRFNKILSRENIVDIDYLVDEVCVTHVPLNQQKIKNSPSLLYIAATDYQTGEPFYFNNRDHNIIESLRASSAMPYFYRKKAVFQGRRYIDGGMVAAIPLDKVIEEGCQEIIVIGTRERGYKKNPNKIPSWIHKLVYPKSAMAKSFENRHRCYNKALEIIANPPKGVKIHYIAPHEKLPISRTTREREKVSYAIGVGYKDGVKFCNRRSEV